MFGDSNPSGSFPAYHLWVTQVNVNRWVQLSDLSNEANDCTIVCGSRVIYNAQARFAGSPYHQNFNTPTGNLCHYKWIFPDDDKFLGATSFNKLHQPGNGAGDDLSIQREQIANTFLRALGVPWLNRHYVAVYVNGVRRGTLMEDAQTPDADLVKEHFPNDNDGWLYKMQPWFEFASSPSGYSMGFNNNSWCNLMPYTTTGGVKKTARYRYNFLVRRTPVSANDFTNVFSLVDAADSYGTANYVANMENLADMENWMRVFAANHAAGNWDAFGCQNAQNLYGYIGAKGTKYSLLMFDFNIVLGNSGSWGPGPGSFQRQRGKTQTPQHLQRTHLPPNVLARLAGTGQRTAQCRQQRSPASTPNTTHSWPTGSASRIPLRPSSPGSPRRVEHPLAIGRPKHLEFFCESRRRPEWQPRLCHRHGASQYQHHPGQWHRLPHHLDQRDRLSRSRCRSTRAATP